MIMMIEYMVLFTVAVKVLMVLMVMMEINMKWP